MEYHLLFVSLRILVLTHTNSIAASISEGKYRLTGNGLGNITRSYFIFFEQKSSEIRRIAFQTINNTKQTITNLTDAFRQTNGEHLGK